MFSFETGKPLNTFYTAFTITLEATDLFITLFDGMYLKFCE